MDYGSLINGRASSQVSFQFSKTPSTTTSTTMRSLWTVLGVPIAASIPAGAAVCTSATTGALPINSLASGSFYYLDKLAVTAVSANPFYFLVSDRLAHMGGLSGTSTSAQTVNVSVTSLSDERKGSTGYSCVSWFLEWYLATGATPVTATVTYTNAAGTGGRTTTVSVPASTSADTMLLITGSGGESIQSVQSVQLGGSTGGIGSFGVTAVRSVLSTFCMYYNITKTLDWKDTTLPKIQDDSCIFFHMVGTASGGNTYGRLTFFSSSE